MPTEEPIALIHWGSPTVEDEEIEEVKLLLEATLFGADPAVQAACAPGIASLRIDSLGIQEMTDALKTFISDHSNIQVLYFSCHGNATSLAFAQTGGPEISYADFAAALQEAFQDDDCVHIVFGSCEAMSATPHVETLMPTTVYAVSGFTCCPLSTDVAGLIASIVQDDVTLFEKLSSANESICRTGVPVDKITDVMGRWKGILDQHTGDPAREVPGTDGVTIIQATRDPDTGTWDRRTTPCA